MGEAAYYIGARFPADKLGDVVKRLEALLDECGHAEDFWQDNRDSDDPEAFWVEFEAEFPLVYRELLRADVDRADCNNSLAGTLSYIGEGGYPAQVSTRHGTTLFYDAYVWHFADWGCLEDWLYRQGAEQVVWFSDENFDYYDALESDLALLALRKQAQQL